MIKVCLTGEIGQQAAFDSGQGVESLDLNVLNGPAIVIDVKQDSNITGVHSPRTCSSIGILPLLMWFVQYVEPDFYLQRRSWRTSLYQRAQFALYLKQGTQRGGAAVGKLRSRILHQGIGVYLLGLMGELSSSFQPSFSVFAFCNPCQSTFLGPSYLSLRCPPWATGAEICRGVAVQISNAFICFHDLVQPETDDALSAVQQQKDSYIM